MSEERETSQKLGNPSHKPPLIPIDVLQPELVEDPQSDSQSPEINIIAPEKDESEIPQNNDSNPNETIQEGQENTDGVPEIDGATHFQDELDQEEKIKSPTEEIISPYQSDARENEMPTIIQENKPTDEEAPIDEDMIELEMNSQKKNEEPNVLIGLLTAPATKCKRSSMLFTKDLYYGLEKNKPFYDRNTNVAFENTRKAYKASQGFYQALMSIGPKHPYPASPKYPSKLVYHPEDLSAMRH